MATDAAAPPSPASNGNAMRPLAKFAEVELSARFKPDDEEGERHEPAADLELLSE